MALGLQDYQGVPTTVSKRQNTQGCADRETWEGVYEALRKLILQGEF